VAVFDADQINDLRRDLGDEIPRPDEMEVWPSRERVPDLPINPPEKDWWRE